MNPKDKPDKPPGKPDKPPGKPPDGGTQPPTSVAGAAYGMLLAITQDSATGARKK